MQVQSSGLVGTTVLRLASDGTAERWRLTTPEQHLAHARSALARALLELFPASGKMVFYLLIILRHGGEPG